MRYIKSVARVLLIVLVLGTAGIYLYSNADTIFTPIGNAIAASLETLSEAKESKQPEVLAVRVPKENVIEDSEIPLDEDPQEPADAAEGYRPRFLFEEMLAGLDEETEQAVIVLGKGSEGNIWLTEKRDGAWYTVMGPFYCRFGKEGLTEEKTDGDHRTPIGFFEPGAAYCAQHQASSWPLTILSSGDVWVTDPYSTDYNRHVAADDTKADYNSAKPLSGTEGALYLDLGHNQAGIPGRGAGVLLEAASRLSNPTDGEIAVSYAVAQRIVRELAPLKAPVVGVFRADDYGWTIEAEMSNNFVFLSDVDKSIRQITRYATNDNFMGRPIAGYYGNSIVVREEMAVRLAEVQASLKEQGLGLLVYDGYRPGRAEQHIFQWIRDDGDAVMKEQFYPTLEKDDLPGIYLAQNSRHTRGIAVDLTLVDLATGQPLDMGTGFDFFAPSSWYSSDAVTPHQQNCRRILRAAMRSAGFTPYEQEWWHFNLDQIGGKVVYDFCVPQW